MLSSSFGLKLKTPAQMSVNDRSRRRSMSRNRTKKNATSEKKFEAQPFNGPVTKRAECRPINEAITTRWLSTSFDTSPNRNTSNGENEATKQLSHPGSYQGQRQEFRCSTPKRNWRNCGQLSSTPKSVGVLDSPIRDTRISTPTRLRVKRKSSRSTQQYLSQTDTHTMRLRFKKRTNRHEPNSTAVEGEHRSDQSNKRVRLEEARKYSETVTVSRSDLQQHEARLTKVNHSVDDPRRANTASVKIEKKRLSKTHSILSGFDIGVDSVTETRPLDQSLSDFMQCADMNNLESLMNFYNRIVNRKDKKHTAPIRGTYV